MIEFIAIFIIVLILSGVLWLFIYLPCNGIAYIVLGDIPLGLLYLIPAFIIIALLLYRHFIVEPESRRKDALRYKYDYPQYLDQEETAAQWNKGFKMAISDGITTISDTNKRAELEQCQRIVNKMAKNKMFDGLHRSFRLTGCHMEIKDSADNTITTIV